MSLLQNGCFVVIPDSHAGGNLNFLNKEDCLLRGNDKKR